MYQNSDHGSTLTSARVAPTPPPSLWRLGLALVGTLLLTIGLLLIPIDVMERLGNFGYLGLFILTLLASASIFLPSPALGVAILAGKTLNPWLVGLCAGVGAGLGEIASYVAGYGGSDLAMQSRYYPRVQQWVQRWGLLTIFVLSVIPSPVFFDLAGIAAGTLRLSFRGFLLACISGKVIRFIALAWLGRWLVMPI